MTAGDIYTVAGVGMGRGAADNGIPATQADVEAPMGVATDSHGNLVIAENFIVKLIQVVAVSTGTFYGQAMTTGDIYTVAGAGGAPDRLGDGGPAMQAAFQYPAGVAVDGAGNLVIADELHGRGRVRVVAVSTGTFYGQAMTAGDIYTVAGRRGGTSGPGDGGPGTKAEIDPYWVAVAPDGDLIVTDPGNARIRRVSH
jgi:hypothetical protein